MIILALILLGFAVVSIAINLNRVDNRLTKAQLRLRANLIANKTESSALIVTLNDSLGKVEEGIIDISDDTIERFKQVDEDIKDNVKKIKIDQIDDFKQLDEDFKGDIESLRALGARKLEVNFTMITNMRQRLETVFSSIEVLKEVNAQQDKKFKALNDGVKLEHMTDDEE